MVGVTAALPLLPLPVGHRVVRPVVGPCGLERTNGRRRRRVRRLSGVLRRGRRGRQPRVRLRRQGLGPVRAIVVGSGGEVRVLRQIVQGLLLFLLALLLGLLVLGLGRGLPGRAVRGRGDLVGGGR